MSDYQKRINDSLLEAAHYGLEKCMIRTEDLIAQTEYVESLQSQLAAANERADAMTAERNRLDADSTEFLKRCDTLEAGWAICLYFGRLAPSVGFFWRVVGTGKPESEHIFRGTPSEGAISQAMQNNRVGPCEPAFVYAAPAPVPAQSVAHDYWLDGKVIRKGKDYVAEIIGQEPLLLRELLTGKHAVKLVDTPVIGNFDAGVPMRPQYYVRHPDDTYSVANPQPVATVAQVPEGFGQYVPGDALRARMVDIVRHLARYPATRADEMSAHDMRDMCRDAVRYYDEGMAMLAASPAAATQTDPAAPCKNDGSKWGNPKFGCAAAKPEPAEVVAYRIVNPDSGATVTTDGELYECAKRAGMRVDWLGVVGGIEGKHGAAAAKSEDAL